MLRSVLGRLWGVSGASLGHPLRSCSHYNLSLALRLGFPVYGATVICAVVGLVRKHVEN